MTNAELIRLVNSIDPQLAVALLMLIGGMIKSARSFRDNGKIPLKKLPWAAKRELARWVRRNYGTVAKPNHPSFFRERSLEEVRQTLAEQGFVQGWPVGSRFEGEDECMRLYFYDPDHPLPNRQVRVRLFEMNGGVEVMALEEPTLWHHPNEHVAETDREFGPANDFVEDRLEDPRPIGYPDN
ncbi:hypothetical protein [Haloterrigena salifodinae]|uniref:hypothetical protein n=1 Tax=Haloterrigena salifodinae TaxID=2675099 RepID=UPI000F8964BF|nr:hypothetical protein [Haloterrigena salifodinae]